MFEARLDLDVPPHPSLSPEGRGLTLFPFKYFSEFFWKLKKPPQGRLCAPMGDFLGGIPRSFRDTSQNSWDTTFFSGMIYLFIRLRRFIVFLPIAVFLRKRLVFRILFHPLLTEMRFFPGYQEYPLDMAKHTPLLLVGHKPL
jgi:hypothetical protein